MGRPRTELDELTLYHLASMGVKQKDAAEEMGVSIPTLARKMASIQEEQGVLMQYRTLQSLELTKLQHKILSNITDDKIKEAPLRDLVLAFKVLKDKEHLIEGKPSEIKGLVGILVDMEREKLALSKAPDVQEAEFEELEDDEEEYIPDL